jgi:hypothetical protein
MLRCESLCLHGRDGHAPFLAALGEHCILIEIRSDFRYGGRGEGFHGATVALKRMLSRRLVPVMAVAPVTVRRTRALARPLKPAPPT